MRDDPVYGELAERESAGFGAAPADKALAPLAAAWTDPDRIGELWLAEWRRRIPESQRTRQRGHRRAGARPRRAFRGVPRPDAARRLAAAARAAGAALAAVPAGGASIPSAAFIFLALAALDLERLRGEILRRVVFPGMPLAS